MEIEDFQVLTSLKNYFVDYLRNSNNYYFKAKTLARKFNILTNLSSITSNNFSRLLTIAKKNKIVEKHNKIVWKILKKDFDVTLFY